jgi:hypothetical protein
MEPRSRRSGAVTVVLSACVALASSCYSTGDGTLPPPDSFYFPTGLAVSQGGNVLYVVNSDFDLQWNGGTIQSYDLDQLRHDAALLAVNPTNAAIAANFVHKPGPGPNACPSMPVGEWADGTGRAQPGQTCAPPVNSFVYVRDSVIIGAFATDIQVSNIQSTENPNTRLFIPVRGDASLTWADIARDDQNVSPPLGSSAAGCHATGPNGSTCYAPFFIDCGNRVEGRCDAAHHAGVDPNEPGNTRHLTMPGEPFAMAQSEDGTAIVLTHQTEQDTSLFFTGLTPGGAPAAFVPAPSLQFVITGTGAGALPLGGDGIVAIPHDKAAFGCSPGAACPAEPNPAYLETNNTTPQLNVLRYYPDDGSSLHRPYILNEDAVALSVNATGSNSRGVIIDPTPRIACENTYKFPDPRNEACAELPANLYIANRTPPSLIVGQVGVPSYPIADTAYNPDSISVFKNIPLLAGPSNVYLAPIVDQNGNYALRVFVVAFDSNEIFIYNPDTGEIDQIPMSDGPFAMTFDPFPLDQAALRAHVPADPRHPDAPGAPYPLELKTYRFAYVASFTNSYLQVIDLDQSRKDKSTFETVVFTLGTPTLPKGTQRNE